MSCRLAAALAYAQRGIAVFPLRPDGNIPHRGEHGLRDATVCVHTIRAMWARHPGSNVGIATGSVSNLFVIDVDKRHGGLDALAKLERQYGRLPTTPVVRTPGGGFHYWFRWPETDKDIRQSTGRVGPGIDVRANRSCVTAPPSQRHDGAYQWVANGATELVYPPAWLVEKALPPELPPIEPTGEVRHADAYVEKVMREELQALSQAVNGTRNDALNRHAFNIGKLVRAGMISERDALSGVEAVAAKIGLGRHEARYTIRRAFRQAPAKIITSPE